MTKRTQISGSTRRALIVGAALVVVCAARATADSPLTDAKNLYASASYEAALQALERVDDASSSEVLEYRALCLLALGRTDDAERVTETLVTEAPMLVPSFEEFPPRFVTLVTDTRRKLLPQLARDLFAKGRTQFKADNKTEAARHFEQVLVLANDPVLRDGSDGADLRTLATGFLDLLRAQTPAEPKAPVVAAAPVPAQPKPAVRSAPVIQAVAVRQTLPPWNVRTQTNGGELKGAVRITVGIDGKVKSGVIVTPTHPEYDAQVLAATRDWLYEPATLNGQPVESERVIAIRVQR